MFKFWYEKLLMRMSFAVAFLSFLGVFVYAYIAEVTFKSPGETAPFTETLIDDNANVILPDQRALPLEKQHRTNKELQAWTSMAVSESLSFDEDDYAAVSQKIRTYYTGEGFQQYQDYLISSGVIESLKKNNYRMRVFVEQPPLLLNGSTIKNIYRWLYQLPVTISFLPRDSYDPLGRSGMINKQINLRLQVRRVKLPDDPAAIQIETWSVTGRR